MKNKIRNLVAHWPTDGEWKEAAVRTVLLRHHPQTHFTGRGFVVDRETSSTQIDILVLKPDHPTLFRDGDLAIVTPNVPSAIAEVKTSLEGAVKWREVALKLAEHGLRWQTKGRNIPWPGIFSFEGKEGQVDNAIEGVCSARKETGIAINSVCLGDDYFIRWWPIGQHEPGD